MTGNRIALDTNMAVAALNGDPAVSAWVDLFAAGCRLLPVVDATCRAYAEVRLAPKQYGTPIPANDVWIAASCVEHGVPMATRDGHMGRVAGLVVLSPP